MSMSDISLKEYIDSQFKAIRDLFESNHKVLLEKIEANEEHNARRRHETLTAVTRLEAKIEKLQTDSSLEVETLKVITSKRHTYVIVWLTILSLITALALIGLASEAGSLIGILIQAL